jgi:hypothetical protein
VLRINDEAHHFFFCIHILGDYALEKPLSVIQIRAFLIIAI